MNRLPHSAGAFLASIGLKLHCVGAVRSSVASVTAWTAAQSSAVIGSAAVGVASAATCTWLIGWPTRSAHEVVSAVARSAKSDVGVR